MKSDVSLKSFMEVQAELNACAVKTWALEGRNGKVWAIA